MKPDNAIPSGSVPLDQPIDQGKAVDQGKTGNDTEKPILGKFKTADEVVPAYEAVEKEKGRLADEIGGLRKQNEMLLNLVSHQSKGGGSREPTKQEPAPDFDKLLSETTNAVESGEMSIGEGLKKVADLSAKQTASIAKQTFLELDNERNAKTFLDQFQKDNPDYAQAVQSGELEAIRAQNPMHDNLSAFYEWKAVKARTEAEQAVKDAFEKGKKETADLASGADATKRVLGKSGSEARATNQNTTYTPTTEAGKIQGMMDVLKAVRSG